MTRASPHWTVDESGEPVEAGCSCGLSGVHFIWLIWYPRGARR